MLVANTWAVPNKSECLGPILEEEAVFVPDREKEGAEQLSKIKTFLMFDGTAEQAMQFYISLFQPAEIVEIHRYGPNEEGPEGTVKLAFFTLCDQTLMCIDSAVKHSFTFTPAMSLFVTCETEEEIDRIYGALAAEGSVYMPLGPYPFSQKFGWVADKFGVSWQLSLGPKPTI
ncbi:MAG: VOC family protein [Alicyclobacillus sp.]|nr:VOC family protein [Alicyclobacillus sp.]